MKEFSTALAIVVLGVAMIAVLNYSTPHVSTTKATERHRPSPAWTGDSSSLALMYLQRESDLTGRMVTVRGRVRYTSQLLDTFVMMDGVRNLNLQLKLDRGFEDIGGVRVGEVSSYDCFVGEVTLGRLMLEDCRETGKSGTIWPETPH